MDITIRLKTPGEQQWYESLPLYVNGMTILMTLMVFLNEFEMLRNNNVPSPTYISLMTSTMEEMRKDLESVFGGLVEYRLGFISDIKTDECFTGGSICLNMLWYADDYKGVFVDPFGGSNHNDRWIYQKDPCSDEEKNNRMRSAQESRENYRNSVRNAVWEVINLRIRPIMAKFQNTAMEWGKVNPPLFPREPVQIDEWKKTETSADVWANVDKVEYSYLNANEFGESALSHRELFNADSVEGQAPIVKVPKAYSDIVDMRAVYRRFRFKNDKDSDFDARESKCVKRILGYDAEEFCDDGLPEMTEF
jgi:hypothetical protein